MDRVTEPHLAKSASDSTGSKRRIVVELGMGDGRLLKSFALANPNDSYVGIEINEDLCRRSQNNLPHNVQVINQRCEVIVAGFRNDSIDRFVALLPDPSLIDQTKEIKWREFYSMLFTKLKSGGHFFLVTELTNDLFEPVPDSDYFKWTGWLISCFKSIGFEVFDSAEGAPPDYSSTCLDQFRGDPARIRIFTLDLRKP